MRIGGRENVDFLYIIDNQIDIILSFYGNLHNKYK